MGVYIVCVPSLPSSVKEPRGDDQRDQRAQRDDQRKKLNRSHCVNNLIYVRQQIFRLSKSQRYCGKILTVLHSLEKHSLNTDL